ncbi:MAG: hypothetical protein ACRBN8_44560 [Nannocystales bacterium]
MADSEPLDFEDIAIRRLAKRARTIHVVCGLISVLTGIAIGLLTAWAVLDRVGLLPRAAYGALFLGPLLGCVVVGRGLARKLLLARAPAWSVEMADEYQLDATQLRGYIRHM